MCFINRILSYCQYYYIDFKSLVVISVGATPVPIPNTEVKTYCADGTVWATAWESRAPPGLFFSLLLFLRRRLITSSVAI